MRRYRTELLKDIKRADKELAELKRQLHKTMAAITPCQYVEKVGNSEEARESADRWIAHIALIQNFRTNCETLIPEISWVRSDLEVLEDIVRKETKENKQC